MKSYLLVGITGSTGSGKTTACNFLRSVGCVVIDADQVGRSIDASMEFFQEFGEACLDPETKRTNRSYLRKLLVEDPTAKARIEAIMKPKIENKIHWLVSDHRQRGIVLIFLDAPTLFEHGFHAKCDYIVTLLADRETKISRVMARDNQTRENTEGILALQLSDEEKARRSNLTIINDGTLQKLYGNVATFLSVMHIKLISDVFSH